jgi:hypothetical protein
VKEGSEGRKEGIKEKEWRKGSEGRKEAIKGRSEGRSEGRKEAHHKERFEQHAGGRRENDIKKTQGVHVVTEVLRKGTRRKGRGGKVGKR